MEHINGFKAAVAAVVGCLTALWNAKDYQGMIELMENTADPGPINGEKPSDHE